MVWLCPECHLTMPDRRSECMESDCSGEHPDRQTEDSDGGDEDDSWGHAHGPYL